MNWLRGIGNTTRQQAKGEEIMDTPKAQKGTWTLIAPDGRQWQAENPIKVVAVEQRERIPAIVATKRIIRAIYEDELPEDITDEEYDLWFENSFIDGVRRHGQQKA